MGKTCQKRNLQLAGAQQPSHSLPQATVVPHSHAMRIAASLCSASICCCSIGSRSSGLGLLRGACKRPLVSAACKRRSESLLFGILSLSAKIPIHLYN